MFTRRSFPRLKHSVSAADLSTPSSAEVRISGASVSVPITCLHGVDTD